MDRPAILSKLSLPSDLSQDKHLLRQTEKAALPFTLISSLMTAVYMYLNPEYSKYLTLVVPVLLSVVAFQLIYQVFIVNTDRYNQAWGNLETGFLAFIVVSLLPFNGGYSSPFFFVLYLLILSTPVNNLLRPIPMALYEMFLLVIATALTPSMYDQFLADPMRIVVVGFSPVAIAFFTTTTLYETLTQKRERDRAEELSKLLLLEKAKLESIVANIGDIVLAVDGYNRIMLANLGNESLQNFTSGFVIGDKLTKVFPDINLDDYNVEQEIKIKNDKGDVGDYSVKVNPMVDMQQNQIGKIVVLHDVKKEKDLDRMKLDFVSMATHELRTPLTSVQGYLSLLNEHQITDKLTIDEKGYLEKAITSTVRLAQLVENLLIVSRIENGNMSLYKEEFYLEDLLQGMSEEMGHLAKAKGLQLDLNSGATQKSPKVLGDPMRIAEVLSNLLSNAISYTQKGGVTLRIYSDGNSVVCSVSDTGQGIPKEAMPNLFTKFFRVQGPLEAGSKGTGLGLYISKSILDSHNGKIWVESELGRGSTFYFSLPMAVHQRTDDAVFPNTHG